MIGLLIHEDVLRAASELDRATTDNIVEMCRTYLRVLRNFRDELHELGAIPEVRFVPDSKIGRELSVQTRKSIRAAIEILVSERKRVETLLESFTLINAFDAAETFNKLKFRDLSNWSVNGGVVAADGGDRMTIPEAVETAGILRREEYVRSAP